MSQREDETLVDDALDEEEEGLRVIEFEDADGNVLSFAELALVEVDGQDYVMLAPLEQVEASVEGEAEGEIEIYLFRYDELEDGSPDYSEIEDDDTYERVRAFCDAQLLTVGEE